MKIAIALILCSLVAVYSDGTTEKKNLFLEYVTRGMYDCTQQYMAEIRKLHLLIREIYENYSVCKREMDSLPKIYEDTGIDALDDLMQRYKQDEGANKVRKIQNNLANLSFKL